jgi:hypothetical protein
MNRHQSVEALTLELFKALKRENELLIIYIEAKLHRESDWIIDGTRR